MSAQAVEKIENIEQPRGALTPMDMLEKAVSSGQGIEVIGKLMDFQDRWDRTQSRKAFDEAIALAKAKIPPIVKNRKAHNSSYADFAAIARVVDPVLSEFGLSYRFRTQQDDKAIRVTCIISHKTGHFEENSLSGPTDSTVGKNAIQAIGSTLTYLQRYTLVQALGLAAAEDDDGKAAAASEVISEEQSMKLREVMENVGALPEAFCKIFKVEAVSALPAARYDEAIKRLNEYGQARKAGK